jgi:proteasome lid subunit RPN8/RPN11
MELRLSRTLAEAIRNETRAAAPQECCGLLLGDRAGFRIDAIRPAANVAADPLHCFEIDPAVLLAAHKAARAGGPEIVGHYHAHPAGEPVPSATDAAMAAGEGEIWLIVGRQGAIRAWRAGPEGGVHGRFDPLEITVADESGLARAGVPRH